ncbi:hypothetical protein [Streptomyces sp. KMM 9044]|uniref:hypothetical protein n=1 Tax=Streptomyces sp. KMM 9044 TaxID=2744474 RepID=UPI002150F1B2|nr:hypothetical protein [Streptomyces sp. KMM 9044]WAX78767.1 hypothetical protein HUV60_014830 [Streptomyces sp. KMM 9044]
MPTDGPSLEWWNEALPPQQRALWSVEFAIDQVEALVDLASAESEQSDIVRAACAESFFVNVRLLAEFLTRPPNNKDFHATDFVDGWQPPPTPASTRLRDRWWLLGSRQVMHLSKERFPDDLAEILADSQITSSASLRHIARDCREVYEAFRQARQPTI